MYDILDLDPNVLDQTALLIEMYCKKQIEITNEYLKGISSLNDQWNDEETIGRLIQEIKLLNGKIENITDEICKTYPPFFKEKAELIRRRPKR